MRKSRFSEIQIVDIHEPIRMNLNIGFQACMTKFNRTLLMEIIQ